MTGLRESCETSMQDSLTSKTSLNAGNIYVVENYRIFRRTYNLFIYLLIYKVSALDTLDNIFEKSRYKDMNKEQKQKWRESPMQ